jgi:outer membrane receptor protein involved in Fe transport
MRIPRSLPILFLLSICAMAQTRSTSALIGHVEDPAHARVAGAEVVLQNSETGLTKKATTDSSGNYSFGNLPLTGLYSVEATKTGFAKAKKQGIQLQAGDTTVLNFSLNVAQDRSLVTVSGTPDSVNTENTQLENRFDLAKINNTPIFGRKLSTLPLLDSAVRGARGTGDLFLSNTLFVINGGGRRQVTYSVDNATGDDSWGRQALFTNVPFSAVQEVSVLTNASSAEYGRTTGGAVNIVTKSGTNDFHGDALVLWRPGSIQARAPLAVVRTDDKLAQGSATVSGPIIRDKTHFLLSYEHSNQLRDSVITSTFAPGVFTGEFHQDLFLARLDHQINASHALSLRSNFDRFDDTNPNDGVGGNSLPSTARIFARRTYSTQLSETWTVNSNTINEARFQFQLASPITQFTAVSPSIQIVRTGLATEGESRYGSLINHQYQFADTVSLNHGHHALRMGVDLLNSSSGGTGQEFGGGFVLGQFTVPGVGANAVTKPISQLTIADVSCAIGCRFTQSFGNQNYNIGEWLTGVFVQDNWTVNQRLVLNLGLRYDNQSFTDDRNNFQPRVGFAYRPFADSNSTVVRGSYGIFVSEIRTNLAAGYAIGGPQGIFTFSAAPGQLGFPTSIATLPAFPAGASLPPRDITVRVGQRDYLNQFFNVSALRFYPDALVNPYTHQWTMGIEHEFSPTVILSIDYAGQHSLKLERPVDLNAPAPLVRTAPGQLRTAAAADATRPIVPVANGYRRILATVNAGSSYYDGLTANLKTKFGRRFSALTSYTWSHAINTVEPDVPQQDPNDSNFIGFQEKATSILDQRHRISISGSYELPWRFTVGSWIQAASGRPYNITTGVDNNGDGSNSDRPVINGVVIPRNSGIGSSTYDISAFAEKAIQIRERMAVSLRAEAFNLTNHNNIYGRNGVFGNTASPSASLGAPLGGISNVDPGRELQFQLRFSF